MSRDIIMPLAIEDIAINAGRREVDSAAVKRLADSIDKIGLRHPISVRKKGDGYALIAGLHRIEAHKKLGREHIPACIVTMTNAEARMWEIAENLHRAELTNIQRAEYIEEWRELKAAQAANRWPPEGGTQPREAGVSKTAEALGISRGSVQIARKIASITNEAKAAATENNLTGTRELLEVAKQPPERQVARVIEISGASSDGDVVSKQANAIVSAWNRAGPEARQRACEVIGMEAPIMDRRFGNGG